MKHKHLFMPFVLGLGLALALLWSLRGEGAAATAAPNATSEEFHVCDTCAYTTIQAAVDAASDGDTVKVAAGTYTSTAAQVVVITKSLALAGSYTPPDWTISRPTVAPTILDGQHARRGVHVARDITVTLDGMTIINSSGSGVYKEAYGNDSHLTIRYCDILSNTAGSAGGGGVFLWGGSLIVEHSRFVSNTVGGYGRGGGVFAREATVTLTHSLVQDNRGANGGGGAELYECTSYVAHNTFRNNANTSSGSSGGAIAATWGGIVLIDNVIQDNVASESGGGHGGGLYLSPAAGRVCTVTDNVILGNVAGMTSTAHGGGAQLLGHGKFLFSRNQVISNVASHGFSGSGGGVSISAPGRYSYNRIQGNRACTDKGGSGLGGGVVVNGEGVWLEGNRILDNWASMDPCPSYCAPYANGGGVFISIQDDVTMTNNIIARNRYADRNTWKVDHGGGALSIDGQTSPDETKVRLYHNTIAENQSPAILNESAAVTMSHTIFYSQPVDVKTIKDTSGLGPVPLTVLDYTLWWTSMNLDPRDGSVITTTNNFTGTPNFITLGINYYHLGSGSQAIDRGPGIGVTTDIDENPRPIRYGFDLGADEACLSYLPLMLQQYTP